MQCPTCSHSSRHEWAILRVHFIALSALFLFLHPIFRHKKAPGLQMRAFQTCASRLALRLEPCMARTQDVGQRGRTTIDVVLLHFLHYFLLLHPIFRHRKTPRPQMQPRQTYATRGIAFRLHPRNVRPAVIPATTNGQSCASIFLHLLHYFLLLQPTLPPQINAEASNAAAPNMRIAACLAA